MRTTLTLTLSAALITSSLPAVAQLPYMPQPRYPAPSPPLPVSSDWMQVRAIAPRTPIRVRAVGLGDQDHQYFVSASERTLTLLVVGSLPRSAKQLLLKLAGSHPELFAAPEKWMEFADGKVRVNPDGVFVGNRKVADLGDVAKTLSAGEVAEVSAEMTIIRPPHDIESPSPAVIGTFFAALYGTMAVCKDKCGSGALAVIIGVPVAVGMIAAGKTGHAMQVVYRAR
jgi:hypothetical protein